MQQMCPLSTSDCLDLKDVCTMHAKKSASIVCLNFACLFVVAKSKLTVLEKYSKCQKYAIKWMFRKLSVNM